MKLNRFLPFAAITLFMCSCTSQKSIRGTEYALMYEQKPTSIVIMPPINETNATEAKDNFFTTMAIPLIDKGYYVFSPYLTLEMFQSEGAYDSEMFIDGDLTQFHNVLGCDAVMFTRIKKWSKKALAGTLTVDVEYILRSATTGDILYKREGEIKLDKSVSSGSNSMIGSLIDIAATAINTATTDKVVAGRECNRYVLVDFPEGPYSPLYGLDADAPAWKGKVKATVKKK